MEGVGGAGRGGIIIINYLFLLVSAVSRRAADRPAGSPGGTWGFIYRVCIYMYYPQRFFGGNCYLGGLGGVVSSPGTPKPPVCWRGAKGWAGV